MKLIELGKIGKATYGKISLLLLIVCLFAICAPFSYLRADQKKNVLVLHSYHKGLEWNDRITQGIESVLQNTNQDIELYFEYMDTKRIYDRQYLQHLYELYRHKYRNRRFDVIISSDDHAFNFLLAHHRELFPDTPVVFCGVNDFKDSMLVGHDMITGVIELSDIKSTVDVALELQPNTKQIFVIVDKTLSGTAVKKLVMKAIPYFKDAVKFTFLEDLDMSEVLERVKILSHDSIVLLIALTADKSGKTFSLEGSCALISRNSVVPVYSHTDSYLGHGIVGGMLDSGYAQGKKAGEMALRILHGEKVKDIPVVKKSPNRYEFDYHQMQRFGIKLSSLSEGSIVINKPYSFYSKYKRLVWSMFAGITGLVLIILILSINIINRRRAEKALQESEATARAILNTPTDAMALIDTSGIILDVNEMMARSMGRRMDELIGLYGWDLLPQDIADQRKAYCDKVIESGKPVRFEDEHQGIWFDNIFYPIFDPQGKVAKVAVMARDMTDRKQAEEALRESEERYRAVFEQAADSIVLLNAETGALVDFNERAHQNLGFTHEEFTKLKIPDFEVIESDKEVARHIKKIIDKGFDIFETKHRTKHGEIRDINVRSRAISLHGKLFIQSIWRDVTDHKQAEEALRESEEKYRTLLDSIEEAYFEVDLRGSFTFFNDSLSKNLGYSKDELMGMNNRDYMPPEIAKEIFELFNQIYRTGKPLRKSAYEVIRKDGTHGFHELVASLMRNEKGEPMGFRGIAHDITDRKQAERERELLLTELEAKNKELESFVYSITHDLKTPLVSLQGFSSLLQREFHDQLDEEGKHYMERIQGNVAHMDSLISDLLELSRIGRAVGPMEEIDVAALLRKIQQNLSIELKEAGTELVVQEPLPVVHADPGRIRQVFTNLIDNALKFRSEDRPLRIEVGCKEERGSYRIHVADNGIGIAPQYQEQIFNPFRKLDPKTEGMGIGMALVKKIVESHGGRVWVESPSTLLRLSTEAAEGQEGGGATFYLTLPRREES